MLDAAQGPVNVHRLDYYLPHETSGLASSAAVRGSHLRGAIHSTAGSGRAVGVPQAATDRGDVPGVVVAVVNKDGVLYREAFDKSRTRTNTPMATDTIFNMVPNRRTPGSGTWAGVFNTHFFIDPGNGIGVVVMMQTLPFYDETSVKGFAGVEEAIYRNLR
jgi:CubicO group peptidase (beta-lactamase class C family)